MKLVGDALQKHDMKQPVIGVFPWGVTKCRDSLAQHRGQVAPCTTQFAPADENGASLNPHHTHFVLVDNGTEGNASWGSEIHLRAALEAAAAQTKGTPLVQLVVQGGPGTLAAVESTAMVRSAPSTALRVYPFCSASREDCASPASRRRGSRS